MSAKRPYPDKPDRVYFFATCIVDLFYPDAGMAGIKLLEREGIEVIFPQDQSCCGQPAYNSGYMDDARAVARNQLNAFPDHVAVVCPSGSCAGMIRKHYADLFAGDGDELRARDLSARIYELTEFLVHVCKVDYKDLGAPTTVTWHGSCHSVREMGVTTEPKDLLAQLENVTLTELAREKECCGFGGTFSVRHGQISEAMVTDKANDVASSGAEVLLTGDCGCLMNITGRMKTLDLKPGGKHIAEFLWERTSHE